MFLILHTTQAEFASICDEAYVKCNDNDNDDDFYSANESSFNVIDVNLNRAATLADLIVIYIPLCCKFCI